MPRKRLRQGHTPIPDHPEFDFLHDYPPLTAEQQKELSAVVTLLEAWEQSCDDTSRQDETAALVAFQHGLSQFKSKHGLDKIPADPIAAMRVLCGQEETVINMLEGQPRVDFKRRIDSLWDQWRGRRPALGTPPVKRVIAKAADALDAIDDLRRQLDTLHSMRGKKLNPESAKSTPSTLGATLAERPASNGDDQTRGKNAKASRPTEDADYLNPTDQAILKAVKRKAMKGEQIALNIDREYIYVRKRLGRLVRMGKVRKTDIGYLSCV